VFTQPPIPITPLMSETLPFVSNYKPLYDAIVEAGPTTPHAAVAQAGAFEEQGGLQVPRVYVSTAITSGGYARVHLPASTDDIVNNDRAAAELLAQLAADNAPFVEASSIMVPTELGRVPEWKDSDYLLFYFCWLAGLSGPGAAEVYDQLHQPVYEPILAVADDRTIADNEQRWPHYEAVARVMLSMIAVAETRSSGKRADGASLMLHLIDTDYSLGCRAETLFALSRNLDRLAPTLAANLDEPLAGTVLALTQRGAAVGAPRQPSELVPIDL
jgi:hypothetical protein